MKIQDMVNVVFIVVDLRRVVKMEECIWLNGKTVYKCNSWKDLEEALNKCVVPIILIVSFNSNDNLTEILIADDLVHNEQDYAFANVPIHCDNCGWKGVMKELIFRKTVEETGAKCPKCKTVILKEFVTGKEQH